MSQKLGEIEHLGIGADGVQVIEAEGASGDEQVGTEADGTDKLSQCMRELLKEGSKDFASFYAANAPAGEQYYGGIVKAYQALK